MIKTSMTPATAEMPSNGEPLPTNPTLRDFARLGAIVVKERFLTDPTCIWAPDDVTGILLRCRDLDLVSFKSLAFMATNMARNLKFKTPEALILGVAGVVAW